VLSSIALLWYALTGGNEELFNRAMKLLFGASNAVSKIKVSFSSVTGSMKDGVYHFKDFVYVDETKDKSINVSLKELRVVCHESFLEVAKKGLDKKLDEGFVFQHYEASGGEIKITIRKRERKPDPNILFKLMRMRDVTVFFTDATLEKTPHEIRFPPNHIESLECHDLHTQKPQILFRDMTLNSNLKGTIGTGTYSLEKGHWQLQGIPLQFVSDTLEPPLNWFSAASLDFSANVGPPILGPKGAAYRNFDITVALRNIAPKAPERLERDTDVMFLPMVAVLQKSRRDLSTRFTVQIAEEELSRRSLEDALVAAIARDLLGGAANLAVDSAQKGMRLAQGFLSMASAASKAARES
jgi:hypothetical protein